MKKLDGTRLGDKKSLNINRLYFLKIGLFNYKIAYIVEEVGDCQKSDTKSFIFNKKSLIFNTKKRLFLTKSLIFNKNRFNSTKTSRINIIFTYSELPVSLRILQQLRSLNYLKKNIIRNRIQLQHISSK